MTQEEDSVTIQNILKGSRTAENTLYNKYKKIIKNYIQYEYPLHKNIDDIVCESLTKIFLNLREYDSTKSMFKSWVLRITKNCVIDSWRKTSKTKLTESFDSMSSSQLWVNNEHILTTDTDFENIDTLKYISTRLSVSDYDLLLMKYVEGYDYNEIGEKYQITSTTVSNRINYVKSKLKKSHLIS